MGHTHQDLLRRNRMNSRRDRNLQFAIIDSYPHILDQIVVRTYLHFTGLVGDNDLHST